MILSEDIEIFRTPSELRAFVVQRVAESKRDSAEMREVYLRKSLWKEFRDEIIPLAMSIGRVYDDAVRIKPVLGNQGYDAVVIDASGQEIERVEITAPYDGKSEATYGRVAVKKGFSIQSIDSKSLPERRRQLIETCARKAQKDYSDCLLMIVVDWDESSFNTEKEQADLIDGIVAELRTFFFRAKRVALYDSQSDCIRWIVA